MKLYVIKRWQHNFLISVLILYQALISFYNQYIYISPSETSSVVGMATSSGQKEAWDSRGRQVPTDETICAEQISVVVISNELWPSFYNESGTS